MSSSDKAIEAALRKTVRAEYSDTLTVKTARAAAEELLDKAPNFFKSHPTWNPKSKEIIVDEVNRIEAEREVRSTLPQDSDDAPAPVAKPKKTAAPPAKRKREAQSSNAKPRKRQKSTPSDDEDQFQDSEDTGSDSVDAKPSVDGKPTDEEGDLSDLTDDVSPKKSKIRSRPSKPSKPVKSQTKTKQQSESPIPEPPKSDAADDDSELSDVRDETPPPPRRHKRSASTKERESKGPSKAAKSKAKPEDVDPHQEEIRKLQGHLVKCGIRKVWGRELMHCANAREKISHLKGMLKDAGMDGRFSEDKARMIKERRELAADLEAVNEGNKNWGVSDEEDNDDGGRPKRRLAKGMEALAQFDDDEESD